MKRLLTIVLGLYLVCSNDQGLTRFTYQAVGGVVFFGDGCIGFQEVILGPMYGCQKDGAQCAIMSRDQPPPVEGLIEPEHKAPTVDDSI